MTMTILGIISGVIALIPVLIKLFKKPVESKIQDSQDQIRQDTDEFKKTNRPKW